MTASTYFSSERSPGLDGRQERIRQAVEKGLATWRQRAPGVANLSSPAAGKPASVNGWSPSSARSLSDLRQTTVAEPAFQVADGFVPSQPGVMASLPRRKLLAAQIGETTPPQMRSITFKAGRLQALGRLLVWLQVFLYFAGGTLWDWLRGKDTPHRRARRMRRTFERIGGTFVKIGQHLAMRIDFLPWVYCVELSRMLDKMAPFPLEEAIAIVERATGRPLSQTFAQFDPDPIGSTSVACVYQARLKDGSKVVVKVRRPGAGELFTADLRVLDWLLAAIEFLTILRPGFTQNMRREFRETLLEELNFTQEARYQDSFRRAAKKSGKKFFTAPRVHFELSGHEVIVEDFASGLWLWELLAALEQEDEKVLALARELNIDPEKVARRLTWVNFWGWDEHLFFHADPHPDNIIVGPDSNLIFIDFGSVSAVTLSKRRALQQNMYYAWKRDALNMARATLILLEPLPPLDLLDFTKELEAYNWQMLYVLESQEASTAWAERTTAIQWIGLSRVAKKYDITIDFHILRLIRAALFYDTLSARLYKGIDVVKEYRKFAAYRAWRARRRVSRNMARQWNRGFDDKIYLRLERLANTGEGLFFRIRHMLVIPSVNFSALMNKWSFAVYTLVKFIGQVILVTGLGVALVALLQNAVGGEMADARSLLVQTASHPIYQLLILLLIFISGRSVLFRMDDKDV